MLINKYNKESFPVQPEKVDFQEHRDYRSNLGWSVKWIQENEIDFPPGIRVLITSTDLPRQLMTFMYRPPKEWPGCGYANHISLQQDQSSLFSRVHNTYDHYKKFLNFDFYNNLGNRYASNT